MSKLGNKMRILAGEEKPPALSHHEYHAKMAMYHEKQHEKTSDPIKKRLHADAQLVHEGAARRYKNTFDRRNQDDEDI